MSNWYTIYIQIDDFQLRLAFSCAQCSSIHVYMYVVLVQRLKFIGFQFLKILSPLFSPQTSRVYLRYAHVFWKQYCICMLNRVNVNWLSQQNGCKLEHIYWLYQCFIYQIISSINASVFYTWQFFLSLFKKKIQEGKGVLSPHYKQSVSDRSLHSR